MIYPNFIYKDYKIIEDNEKIYFKYFFEIENLKTFETQIEILKKDFKWKHLKSNLLKEIVFNLGMVEAISYFKATCSPNFYIECGNLTSEQCDWFRKLYYLGLGEFRYKNKIATSENEFVKFFQRRNSSENSIREDCSRNSIKENNSENFIRGNNPENSIKDLDEKNNEHQIEKDQIEIKTENKNNDKSSIKIMQIPKSVNSGIIVPVGGGKDSNVTLELLKNNFKDITPFRIGSHDVAYECIKTAGFDRSNTIEVNRILDKNLIDLNNKGFLNGHTPFSAMVAFLTYAISFMLDKKYIALSNENSANETNVKGEEINHQYSKTLEFENDFREYCKKYFKADIEYFSFLRPISELQIAMLFSRYKKYYHIFKSCNVGSKQTPWVWCGECPKCLFVYIILSPFIAREELVDIFGSDLFNKENLLNTFIELCGFGEIKPFECVGTYSEVRYCVSKVIENTSSKDLPFLLKYYKEHFELENTSDERLRYYNSENNLPIQFEKVLKENIYK